MTQPQYPQGQYQQPQYPGYPQQPGQYGLPPGGYAPMPKPPRPPMTPQQKALAVVGGSLGIFLIALLILGLTTTNSTTQTATSTGDQIIDAPRSSGSNEQDIKGIKKTIAGMAEAAKANDFKKMLTFFCAKYREAFKDIAGSGKAPDLNALTKADNGPSKITGIDIDGDTAVLHITDAKGKHDIEFKKESAAWKFCPAA